MTYVVMCYRSSSSIMGYAEAPMKSNGQIKFFSSLEEARKIAQELEAKKKSQNVHYAAKEWEDD